MFRYAIGGDKDEWATAQAKVSSRVGIEGGEITKTISIKSIKRKAEESDSREKKKDKKSNGGGKKGESKGKNGGSGKSSKR